MQTLLDDENKTFKSSVEIFTRDFLNKPFNIKYFWQSLYKNGFVSSNNSFLNNVLLTQSVCSVNPGIGLFLLTQFACIEIIKNHANNKLKEKYLNKLISGDYIACFSITEPNAGSDVTMIETTAKKESSNYIINGHKIWASNASISDVIILFAQTKEYKDKSGITCFIIPSKNVEIKKDTPKLGVQVSPSNEIFIKDLKIPAENQIGETGDGIKIALSAITIGRIYCAAQAVGLLEGILNESVKHAVKRNQFGKRIIDNQAVAWYVADMTKDLDGAKLLLYKAVWAKENKSNELNKLSSMAKYFSTEYAQKHSVKAVQIFGGSGLNEDSYVAQAYKDAKVLEIYEGTNEIQKVIIARELF